MYSAALLLAFFLRVGAAQPSCWAYPYCLSNTMKIQGTTIDCPTNPYANVSTCTAPAGSYLIDSSSGEAGGNQDCCLLADGGCAGFCESISGVCKLKATDYTTWQPTSVPSALQCENYRVCKEGYYAINDSPLQCEACQSQPTASSCAIGYIPSTRCYKGGNLTCVPCTSPSLLSDAWEYGEAFRAPSCLVDFKPGCVYYQTPAYDVANCSLRCKAGYMNTGNSLIGSVPVCEPCDTSCMPGFTAPSCAAGTNRVNVNDNKCQPCSSSQLPANANWTSGCEWICNNGFYYNSTGRVCTKCANPCVGTGVFMNCQSESSGYCVNCGNTLKASNEFFTAMPWENMCNKQTCSAAIAGQTWLNKSCSRFSDAVVLSCTRTCPAGISYMSSNCTLLSDSVCSPCTAALDGQLLVRNCTPTSDAQYSSCPLGQACSSGRVKQCVPPLVVGGGGLCVCPPATVVISGLQLNQTLTALTSASFAICTPIPCPDGSFPDARVDGCSPCSVPGSAPSLTLPGILGSAACACPPGYFLSNDVVYPMRCWPCGDLQCEPSTQRQTACPGGRCSAEPSCACQIPAGSVVVPRATGTCAFECDAGDGYVSVAEAPFTPAVWQGFPVYGGPFAQPSAVVNPSFGANDRLLPIGSDIILYTVGNRELWFMSRQPGGGAWSNTATKLPILEMTFLNHSNPQSRPGDLISIHILPHQPLDIFNGNERARGFWLLVVYNTTECEDITTTENRPCTILERFLIGTPQQMAGITTTYCNQCSREFCTVSVPWCAYYFGYTWGGSEFATKGSSMWQQVLATNSLTMSVTQRATEWLYWSAISSAASRSAVLVRYSAPLYTIPPTNQVYDPVTDETGVPLPCGLTSMAFAQDSLYAFAPCAGVLKWRVNINTGELTHVQQPPMSGAQFRLPPSHRLLSLMDIIPAAVNGISTLLDNSLWSGLTVLGAIAADENNITYMAALDLLNKYSWRYSSGSSDAAVGGTLVLGTDKVSVVAMGNTTSMALYAADSMQLCDIDKVSYNRLQCQPVHCYIPYMAGGPSMLRLLGSTSLLCAAGNYWDTISKLCLPCNIAYYCPGLLFIAFLMLCFFISLGFLDFRPDEAAFENLHNAT